MEHTHVDIVVRHPDFGLSESLPKYWLANDPFATHFFDAFSLLIPIGEAMFIETVRLFRDKITDPKLREEVRAFFAQESLHLNEHHRYNKVLGERGYKVKRYEALVQWFVDAKRFFPNLFNLACVTCVEHFTAILGVSALRDDVYLTQNAQENYLAMWQWHSVEEIEHKAVAYDVYKVVGGGYFTRVFAMLYMSLMLLLLTIYIFCGLLWQDGFLFSPKTWLRGFYFLFIKPAVITKLVLPYLRFYKPGFHPWETDDRPLIARWKQKYDKKFALSA